MMYGLIMATTVTATILCVAIQRRHLMVQLSFHGNFLSVDTNLPILDTPFFFPCRCGDYLLRSLFLMWWGLFLPMFSFSWHPFTISSGAENVSARYVIMVSRIVEALVSFT